MITGDCIACTTCEKKYFIRVGVGIEEYQTHSFDCVNCNLPITVALRSNPKTASAKLEIVENAKIIEFDMSYTVVNLHPSFAFTKETIHDRHHRASLEYLGKIYPFMRVVKDRRHQDAALQFDIPNVKQVWSIVKNILILNERKSEKHKNHLLLDYEKQRKKYIKETSINNVSDVINDFFYSAFYPKIDWILTPSIELSNSIKEKNEDEYNKFIDYYKKDIRNDNLNRYLSIFTDYFKIDNQLRQMLVHARIDDHDNLKEIVVGSKQFDDIKLYYGQAFEALTSNLVTLACLNNILGGRKFDEFKSMNLNKYIKNVDKANKANPFKDTKEFADYAIDLDSTLRNGSHHASIFRKDEIIFYRSGGTGAEHQMTYSEYIHICNRITIKLAALLRLELYIFSEPYT